MREALKRVSLLLLGTLLGLGAAEALVRITNGARYAERPVFYPWDEALGWAPAPNLDDVYYGGDFAVSVATDAGGNRLGTLGRVPDGAKRVLLVGDSYTFGWGVSTEETFASYLDERLAGGGAGEPRRVVNLGVAGYGTVQSALRLERHLAADPDAEISEIVVLHSHNDPADNVTFETARRGLRRYVQQPRNRGLHLHNLVRLVTSTVRRRPDAGPTLLPGGHRDFLWTVGAFLTDEGRRIDRRLEGPPGSDEEALWIGQEVLPTYDRKSLTRLQVELLRESVDRIHRLARDRDAVVVHIAIHTAPSWYLEPLEGLVEASAPGIGRRRWCGRVPVDGFDGPLVNDHSGSHFTPTLNDHYAARVASWLGGESCPGEDPA